MRTQQVLSGLVMVALLGGCGGEGSDTLPRQAVGGTVTFDGQPLKTGSIQFQPEAPAAGGTQVSAGALVADGRFQIPYDQGLTPGRYKVLVFSHGDGGGDAAADASDPPGEPGAPGKALEERIPSQYNAATTLSIEVKPGQPAKVELDLKK